jgi:geranylgeranyl reductase family protein
MGAVNAIWDVAIVGAGPAGSAAAIGALHADPAAQVLLLDRSTFPRDKCCGDAVLGTAMRQLREHDVSTAALLDGYRPAADLTLTSAGGTAVTWPMPDPMIVIPRVVFDARLFAAARTAGATFQRHSVRRVRDAGSFVDIDDRFRARIVIGADGAESAVRRSVAGSAQRDVAVAIRGYDLDASDHRPRMVLDNRPGLAYAWRFPTTHGRANAGYGHLLQPGEPVNRASLVSTVTRLLPEVRLDPDTVRAHRLPLSTSRQRPDHGRILLAGDAAAMVNPISGEGIYYAISSGLAAGASAVAEPDRAAARYHETLRQRFGRHHRHVAVMARLSGSATVLEAALRAAGRHQRVFDDIAALGLAEGTVTAAVVFGLTAQLLPQLAAKRLGALGRLAEAIEADALLGRSRRPATRHRPGWSRT